MELLSSFIDKTINITADLIVGIAIHVPFLLHALISLPIVQVEPSTHSVPEHVVTSVSSATTTTQSQKSVRPYSTYRAFSFEDFLKDETSSLIHGPYVNASSTHTFTLKLLTDKAHQSRNPSFEVYLDGKNVGEIVGQGISISKFSNDQSHVFIRTRNVVGCAGACQSFDLYLLDFVHQDLTRIPRPQEITGYQNASKSAVFTDVTEFVSLNPWVSDHEIAVESYFVGIGSDGRLYQATGGEAWIYDIDTGEYRIYPGED